MSSPPLNKCGFPDPELQPILKAQSSQWVLKAAGAKEATFGYTGYVSEGNARCSKGYKRVGSCINPTVGSDNCKSRLGQNFTFNVSTRYRDICHRSAWGSDNVTGLITCCTSTPSDDAWIGGGCFPAFCKASDSCIPKMQEVCPKVFEEEPTTSSNFTRCLGFCEENPENCGFLKTKTCVDKMGNDAYNDLCGCYYPDPIMNKLVNDLSKLYKLPQGVIGSSPKCYYPPCNNARVKLPESDKITCPAIAITNCFSVINIDNEGNIIGKVTINSSEQCTTNYQRQSDDPSGLPDGGGTSNKNGTKKSNAQSNTATIFIAIASVVVVAIILTAVLVTLKKQGKI